MSFELDRTLYEWIVDEFNFSWEVGNMYYSNPYQKFFHVIIKLKSIIYNLYTVCKREYVKKLKT